MESPAPPSESGGWGLLPPGDREPASGLSQPGAGPPLHRPVHRAAVPASIGTKRGPGFRQDLFLYEQDCKPGSVSNSHLSRRTVAGTLQPPRERPGQPWGSDPLLPYRCCSGWSLQHRTVSSRWVSSYLAFPPLPTELLSVGKGGLPLPAGAAAAAG